MSVPLKNEFNLMICYLIIIGFCIAANTSFIFLRFVAKFGMQLRLHFNDLYALS